MSKKHPGQSESYQQKQQKRAENEHDREMRKNAKEFFFAQTGENPAAHRARITEIKKIFAFLDSQPSIFEEAALKESLEAIVSNVKTQTRKS
jgi:hypothetical protein